MQTSLLFKLVFANITILSCFCFFFLIITLYFSISAFIAQIINPVAVLVIPAGIPSKEEKEETQMHAVTEKGLNVI